MFGGELGHNSNEPSSKHFTSCNCTATQKVTDARTVAKLNEARTKETEGNNHMKTSREATDTKLVEMQASPTTKAVTILEGRARRDSNSK